MQLRRIIRSRWLTCARATGGQPQVTMTHLATPITTDDGSFTDVASEIVWTGGQIAPGEYESFEVFAQGIPSDADSLSFPTVQTYADGTTVSWIDPTPPGGPEPDHPAPVLTLTVADILRYGREFKLRIHGRKPNGHLGDRRQEGNQQHSGDHRDRPRGSGPDRRPRGRDPQKSAEQRHDPAAARTAGYLIPRQRQSADPAAQEPAFRISKRGSRSGNRCASRQLAAPAFKNTRESPFGRVDATVSGA